MSEKDEDLAGGVIYQINKERCGHQMGDCAGDKCPDWITRQVEIVTAALTTIRKESIAIIVGQPVEHYIYSGAQPMAASTFRDNAVKAIEATVAIEAAKNQRAAASDEEGGGDG